MPRLRRRGFAEGALALSFCRLFDRFHDLKQQTHRSHEVVAHLDYRCLTLCGNATWHIATCRHYPPKETA
jgi:hypothetical protein